MSEPQIVARLVRNDRESWPLTLADVLTIISTLSKSEDPLSKIIAKEIETFFSRALSGG